MHWILGIATLLGGIAAVYYFWDRRVAARRKSNAQGSSDEPDVKWVDLNYPADCGLQRQLEQLGYTVRWSREDKLARRLDLEGWEKVVTEEAGQRFVLKVHSPDSSLVLIKRKEAPSPS